MAEDTAARLERQRWAMKTVRSRRREAAVGIVALMTGVPALVFWLTEAVLPAWSSGPALLLALAFVSVGCFWLIARATRCPVCTAQHDEGGHGVFDTLRFRAGQPQIGRTANFLCEHCGTRLT
jgi:hypothetical protein